MKKKKTNNTCVICAISEYKNRMSFSCSANSFDLILALFALFGMRLNIKDRETRSKVKYKMRVAIALTWLMNPNKI